MSGFNMPPGVSVSDIPGNSDEDAAWDSFIDAVMRECSERGWDADDALEVWRLGSAKVRLLDSGNLSTEGRERE